MREGGDMLNELMLNVLCLVMNYATPKSYFAAHFLHFHKPVRKSFAIQNILI